MVGRPRRQRQRLSTEDELDGEDEPLADNTSNSILAPREWLVVATAILLISFGVGYYVYMSLAATIIPTTSISADASQLQKAWAVDSKHITAPPSSIQQSTDGATAVPIVPATPALAMPPSRAPKAQTIGLATAAPTAALSIIAPNGMLPTAAPTAPAAPVAAPTAAPITSAANLRVASPTLVPSGRPASTSPTHPSEARAPTTSATSAPVTAPVGVPGPAGAGVPAAVTAAASAVLSGPSPAAPTAVSALPFVPCLRGMRATSLPMTNRIYENEASVGVWGGICTCALTLTPMHNHMDHMPHAPPSPHWRCCNGHNVAYG